MNATPSSGRCNRQKKPRQVLPEIPTSETSATFCFVIVVMPLYQLQRWTCLILSNRVLDRETSRVHALWNAQLRGNILDQTKGLSRWDSDANRAPLCKEPQGECLKDAASGWTERSG